MRLTRGFGVRGKTRRTLQTLHPSVTVGDLADWRTAASGAQRAGNATAQSRPRGALLEFLCWRVHALSGPDDSRLRGGSDVVKSLVVANVGVTSAQYHYSPRLGQSFEVFDCYYCIERSRPFVVHSFYCRDYYSSKPPSVRTALQSPVSSADNRSRSAVSRKDTEDRNDIMANMVPQILLYTTLVLSMAMGVITGIVPESNQDPREQTTFGRNFWSTADRQHYRISQGGEVAELVLDPSAAAGFASKMRYLFGRFTIQMKVHRGDSAGTVSTFYTSSLSGKHDELDFEFLGNENGKPYVLQTNVYASGVGDREQRIRLWFDPTEDFHTYGIHWNREMVIFFVDDTPIRIYKNCEDLGVPFPNRQAQSVFASLWNGEEWATQNGAIKLNWTHAPFIVAYKNYEAEGCEVPWYKGNVDRCNSSDTDSMLERATVHQLTTRQVARLQWVTENLLMYDYCKDFNRYPQGHPECSRNSGLQLIGPLPLKHLDGLKVIGHVKKGYYSDI